MPDTITGTGNTPVHTFRLDDTRWDRLNTVARTRGITASELLRDLIDQIPEAA